MTYNQLVTTLQSLMESHAMIKMVKNATVAIPGNTTGVSNSVIFDKQLNPE